MGQQGQELLRQAIKGQAYNQLAPHYRWYFLLMLRYLEFEAKI